MGRNAEPARRFGALAFSSREGGDGFGNEPDVVAEAFGYDIEVRPCALLGPLDGAGNVRLHALLGPLDGVDNVRLHALFRCLQILLGRERRQDLLDVVYSTLEMLRALLHPAGLRRCSVFCRRRGRRRTALGPAPS